MKNQKINYKLKIFCLLFFLSITFEAIGQEIIREEGSMYLKDTFNEDSLKSRYLIGSGSKKHRLEEIMMPVERSLSTKSETIKSDQEWNIHRVHNGKCFSGMSDRSIALDANGKPHIAYGQTHLYYAWYDEQWHTETVDDSWDVGWYASLALDSDGYPHISYYDRDPNGDLKYAYKDENGWHISTVDDNGDDGSVGWFTSIALDENNQPHISYHDGTNGNLKYAYWDGSEWLIQTVDSEGVVGYWCTSLAIGPNNFPHISYYDWTNGNLKYTHWDGSDWQIVTVDNDDDVGGYSSLTMDENGYPHISYLDYTNARLKYTFWNGSEWQLEIVDEGEEWGVGWFNSIVLDESGNPHISYFDNTTGKLKYACFNESGWDIKSVKAIIPDEYPWSNSYNIGGFFTSIVLDINGNPHISSEGWFEHFGAYPDGLLGYSYFDGSTWNFDAVDSLISAGITTSIAVDNDTVSHIGYMRSDGRCSYTSSVDNHWEKKIFGQVAYGIKEPGSGSFIALDDNGWPHMIYHQKHGVLISSYGNPVPYYPFRKTWFDGTDWHYESLWTSYLVGSGLTQREPLSSSLTFDQSGVPHILVATEVKYSYQTSNYQLQHRYFSDSVWHTSTIVERGSAVGVDNSIAISSDGIPHISYRGLKYGWLEGEGWNIQTIDSVGGGYYNSLKLDSNNFPHISYYDTLITALKYAHLNGSEWQIEIVDSSGVVGKYTSLALDANKYPHISYYDETNGNLKYAYWDGDQWQIEIVDSYRTVGMYTSLALDANDNRCISYYDASFGDLKYASKSALETFTITASGDENGSIVPSGEVEVESGEDQKFTVIPDEGFRVVSITVDGSDIDLANDENWDAENGEYTFSNVIENHTIEVDFDDATSISIEDKNKIKVYPNPTSNKLWVEFYHQGNEKLVIVLQNQQGQTVRQLSVTQTGSLRISMPTQNLASGVYLLTIKGTNVFPVKKVMIEK